MKKILIILTFIFSFLIFDLNVFAKENVNYNGCANLYYDDIEKNLYFYLDGQEYFISDATLYAAAQNGNKIYWYYLYQPYYYLSNTALPTSDMGYLIITIDRAPQIYGSKLIDNTYVGQSTIDKYYPTRTYMFNSVYIQPFNNTIGYDPSTSYNFYVDEQYSSMKYSNYDGLYQRFKYNGYGAKNNTLLYSTNTNVPGALVSYGALNDPDYILEMIDYNNSSKRINVEKTNNSYCKSEGSFLLETEEIYAYNDGSVIAEKITAIFGNVDIENYKYEYIDVNATDDFTEFVPNENGLYEWFYLTNNAFCVYVTDRNTGEKVSSNCEIESNINEDNEYFVITEDSSKDVYIEYEGKEILYSKYINVRLNDISLVPYIHEYIFPYYRTSTWSDVSGFDSSGNGMDFWLTKDEDIILEIVGLNTGVQYAKKYSLNGVLEEINNLPEFVTWEENCRSNNTYCITSVRFVNYNEDIHNYFVRKDSEEWKQVYPGGFNKNQLGFYNFPESDDVNTYCAMITDKKNNVVLQECYSSVGVLHGEINVKIILKYFNKFADKIKSLFNFITYFFNGLPIAIQNMFVFALLMIVLLIFFKILL